MRLARRRRCQRFMYCVYDGGCILRGHFNDTALTHSRSHDFRQVLFDLHIGAGCVLVGVLIQASRFLFVVHHRGEVLVGGSSHLHIQRASSSHGCVNLDLALPALDLNRGLGSPLAKPHLSRG